jgi:amino acid transporter
MSIFTVTMLSLIAFSNISLLIILIASVRKPKFTKDLALAALGVVIVQVGFLVLLTFSVLIDPTADTQQAMGGLGSILVMAGVLFVVVPVLTENLKSSKQLDVN